MLVSSPRTLANCFTQILLRYSPRMPTEKRRSPRISANKKVQVTYVDDLGHERFEIVNAQEIGRAHV